MEDSCDSRLQNCHQIVNSQHWKELVRFLSNAMGNKLSGPKRVMRLGSKISCSKHKRLVIYENNYIMTLEFEHSPMYLIHNPLSFKRNELPFHDTSLTMLGALVHCLKRHTACEIQNSHWRAQKWPMGSGKVSTPRFWGAPVIFL